MHSARLFWLALVVSVLFPVSFSAKTAPVETRQALALLESAEQAKIIRAGDDYPLNAFKGQFLFESDILVAKGRPVVFAYCPPRSEPRLFTLRPSAPNAEARAVFRATKVAGISSELSSKKLDAHCDLPELPIVTCPTEKLDIAGRMRQQVSSLWTLVSDATRHARDGEFEKALERVSIGRAIAPEAGGLRSLGWPGKNYSPKTSAGPGARTFAVVVGISEYKFNGKDQIPNLKFADDDAASFVEYLKSERGGSVPESQIFSLINEKATTAMIDRCMRHVQSVAGPQDTVAFFVSSHGAVYNDVGYLITFDTVPDNLVTTAYPMPCFTSQVKLFHSGRVRLFVDACHAGEIHRFTRKEKNLVHEGIARQIQDSDDRKTFMMLSSQPGQYSYEHEYFGGGHGAFTYFLLWGLTKGTPDEAAFGDKDEFVSLYELADYVQHEVQTFTRHAQRPTEVVPRQDEGIADLRTSCTVKLQSLREELEEDFGKLLKKDGRQPLDAGGTRTSSAPPLPERVLNLISLEDEGQRIVSKYLQGDEQAQVRADFARGANIYEQTLLLQPNATKLEARKEFFIGRVLIFDKQYGEAVAHLERSIRFDPRDPIAYNALGIAYLELGRFDLARATLHDAIRRAPYWSYPRHNLALTQMQQGDYDAAIATYRDAMTLAPYYSYLPYNLGIIYQKTNRLDEADRAYETAVQIARRLSTPRAAPWIALGLLRAREGKVAEAADHYNEAIGLAGKTPDREHLQIARHNLAVLLADQMDGWPRALSLWKENIADGYEPSRFALAEALWKRGLGRQAIAQYREIVASSPNAVSAWLRLADLLAGSGDDAAARRELHQALKVNPGHNAIVRKLTELQRRSRDG